MRYRLQWMIPFLTLFSIISCKPKSETQESSSYSEEEAADTTENDPDLNIIKKEVDEIEKQSDADTKVLNSLAEKAAISSLNPTGHEMVVTIETSDDQDKLPALVAETPGPSAAPNQETPQDSDPTFQLAPNHTSANDVTGIEYAPDEDSMIEAELSRVKPLTSPSFALVGPCRVPSKVKKNLSQSQIKFRDAYFKALNKVKDKLKKEYADLFQVKGDYIARNWNYNLIEARISATYRSLVTTENTLQYLIKFPQKSPSKMTRLPPLEEKNLRKYATQRFRYGYAARTKITAAAKPTLPPVMKPSVPIKAPPVSAVGRVLRTTLKIGGRLIGAASAVVGPILGAIECDKMRKPGGCELCSEDGLNCVACTEEQIAGYCVNSIVGFGSFRPKNPGESEADWQADYGDWISRNQ